MSLNFPANPNDGDTYNDGTITWTYSSTTKGWSRPPTNTTGNDPWVHIDNTSGSALVGMSLTDISGMVGVDNTVCGRESGAVIGTGKQNTLMGSGAGKVLVDGDSNTLLGYKAGASLAGVNTDTNVFIGSQAQAGYAQANDCIVIGAYANTAASNETDEIVIGAGVVGSGSNTTTIGKPTNVRTVLRGAIDTGSFTVAEAALLTPIEGQIIYVSDAAAGGVHCTYNGSNWVLMGTQTTVTT